VSGSDRDQAVTMGTGECYVPRVEFRIFVDPVRKWMSYYELPDIEPLIYEASTDDLIYDLAKRAIRDSPPAEPADADIRLFHITYLEDGRKDGSPFVFPPKVVIDKGGEFLWPEGAIDRITVGDLARARDRGLFHGDPYALLLNLPLGGDGVLPGWEEFFAWLQQLPYQGASALLFGGLAAGVKRWRERGARTPYAHLHVILASPTWYLKELAVLLGMRIREARDVLEALGYDESAGTKGLFVRSNVPERGALRRAIIKQQLHGDPEKLPRRIEDPGPPVE
jgi:hypothetical protein